MAWGSLRDLGKLGTMAVLGMTNAVVGLRTCGQRAVEAQAPVGCGAGMSFGCLLHAKGEHFYAQF